VTTIRYEIYYKLHIALPPSITLSGSTITPSSAHSASEEAAANKSLLPAATTNPRPPPLRRSRSSYSHRAPISPTTFLLHVNAITSAIGVATFFLLAIPIPALHFIGWEIFEIPPPGVRLAIVGIMCSGVVYNAGFMLLLSIWGPVLAVRFPSSLFP
jgi:hypothetical protein